MNILSNRITNKDVNDYLILVPIHKYPEFREQCMLILNQQWPRSETLRYRSLDCSCNQLPTSLVLVDTRYEEAMVLGHSRLNYVPNERETVWIESVVIHHNYRGKGYGTILMLKTEAYAFSLGFKNATLSTHGEEKFYEKLGYEFSQPVCIYGGMVNRLFLPNTFVPCSVYSTNKRLNNENDNSNVKANNVSSPAVTTQHCTLTYNILESNNIPLAPPLPPRPPPSHTQNVKLEKSDIQRIDEKNNKIYMRKTISFQEHSQA